LRIKEKRLFGKKEILKRWKRILMLGIYGYFLKNFDDVGKFFGENF
jgi:hypothetical protein